MAKTAANPENNAILFDNAYNIFYVWVGVLSTFRCVFNYCSLDTILSLTTFNTRHILNFQYPIWYCLKDVFRLLLWFLFAIRLVKVFFLILTSIIYFFCRLFQKTLDVMVIYKKKKSNNSWNFQLQVLWIITVFIHKFYFPLLTIVSAVNSYNLQNKITYLDISSREKTKSKLTLSSMTNFFYY